MAAIELVNEKRKKQLLSPYRNSKIARLYENFKATLRHHTQAAFTLAEIVGVFFVTYAPFHIMIFGLAIDEHFIPHDPYMQIFGWIGASNVVLDPLIYIWLTDEVKQEIYKTYLPRYVLCILSFCFMILC